MSMTIQEIRAEQERLREQQGLLDFWMFLQVEEDVQIPDEHLEALLQDFQEQ